MTADNPSQVDNQSWPRPRLPFRLQYGFQFQPCSRFLAPSWVVIGLRSGATLEGLRLISGKVRMFSNLTADETAATGRSAHLHPTRRFPGEIVRESVGLSSGSLGLEPGGFLRWGASGLSEMCLWCACPLRSSVNTRNTS